MTLREIFQQTQKEEPELWLYLSGDDSQWTLDTEAVLFDPSEFDRHMDESVLPESFIQRGLRETLDALTVKACVEWADQLVGCPDDTVRLESFLYYYRFDAFLPKVGAPNPPPWEETRRKLDLEFYDKLMEDQQRLCKHEGCGRRAVQFGIFCKRHHFEMIKSRACPFEH